MTRSIVLRFDATCFDCGSSLPAGTTARWFGKGRVSCCGDIYGNRAPASQFVPPAAPAPAPAPTPPGDSAAIYRDALRKATDDAVRAAGPSARVAELLEKAKGGLTQPELAELSASGSGARLVIRLRSGSRLVCAAYDAAHVCRCIEESLLDKVRDVLLAN